jgi:NAD(P)-dependent dehydrogenase (short-subunit alcohol dehydrogenase family)
MGPIEEQIILVTGSTDGIGKITARKLSRMGARVLVHGRSRKKCAATVAAIRENTGNKKLSYYVADLSSLSAVQELAKAITSEHPRLDVLINNAGVGPGAGSDWDRPLSQDGYELLFAVNYLAPYLLTHLLTPVLRRSAPSRIVNVCSAAQEAIDFDDVMLKYSYHPMQAYARSKLALTMFTFDLAERFQANEITANCLHPGSLLDTKMVRDFAAPQGSAESGAQVEIYVATAPDLQDRTGVYFEGKHAARAYDQAYDRAARQKLRHLAEELTDSGRLSHFSRLQTAL